MAGHLDDWVAETPESIAARLAGAQEAQRQTRFTLGMMALVSMMMLILSYNAYLSFDSRWVLARAIEGTAVSSLDQAKTVSQFLTAQAIQDWAESRNAMIQLLGIRVSVDDAPVLGTISLFVFALWLLLVTRRENHTVGSLLRDTDTPRDDDSGVLDANSGRPRQDLYTNGQRWLIFHTLAANNLFVTFDRSMSRIQSLGGENRLTGRNAPGMAGVPSKLGFAFARVFFFWFPVGASLLVFGLDRISYFQRDPFAPNAAVPGTDAPLFFESMAVFLLCWIPLVICCHVATRYSRATDAVLRDYGQRLQSDLLRHAAQVKPAFRA